MECRNAGTLTSTTKSFERQNEQLRARVNELSLLNVTNAPGSATAAFLEFIRRYWNRFPTEFESVQ